MMTSALTLSKRCLQLFRPFPALAFPFSANFGATVTGFARKVTTLPCVPNMMV